MHGDAASLGPWHGNPGLLLKDSKGAKAQTMLDRIDELNRIRKRVLDDTTVLKALDRKLQMVGQGKDHVRIQLAIKLGFCHIDDL